MSNVPTVVVTGASGYIGTELVKQLLEAGYNVRGTVRDPSNEKKVAHLTALGNALPGRLTLHAANLLAEGAFDEIVRGALYVFHTASPFFPTVEDPQRDLIDPALKGTTNVLNSIAKTKDTVKRVVLTPSVAAVRSTKSPAPPVNGELYTEADWNEASTIDTEPYPLSKALAEKAAWDIAKKEGLDLVTINPVFVIGPVISSRTDATSIKLLKDMLEGQGSTFSNANLWYIDVRDVAKAHVRAAELPQARGRYFLNASQSSTPGAEVVDIVRASFPGIAVKDGTAGEPVRKVDNSKLIYELGVKPITVEEAFADMARTLIATGVAKPRFHEQ